MKSLKELTVDFMVWIYLSSLFLVSFVGQLLKSAWIPGIGIALVLIGCLFYCVRLSQAQSEIVIEQKPKSKRGRKPGQKNKLVTSESTAVEIQEPLKF